MHRSLLGASIFKLTTSNMKFHEARYASRPSLADAVRIFLAITVSFEIYRQPPQALSASTVENWNLRFCVAFRSAVKRC